MGHSSSATDKEACPDRSAAAAALVDVAAGLAGAGGKQSADTSAPPAGSTTANPSTSGVLPTNSVSRKMWDRDVAAPPSDVGVSSAGRSIKEIYPHAFIANNSSAANAKASSAATSVNHGFSSTHIVQPAPPAQHLHLHHHTHPQMHTHPTMPAPAPAHWHPAHIHAAAAAHAAHQAHAAAAQAASLGGTQHPATSVFMSMSSIGFGVDPSCPYTAGDATEAAVRAVRDAMERSAVRMPTAPAVRQTLSIHIKLGVPPRPSGEPMQVDVMRLLPLLPQSVTLLPVELTVGGLLIDHKEIEASSSGVVADQQHPTICTAVACVTLQQSSSVKEAEASYPSSQGQPMAVDASPGSTGSGGHWPPGEHTTRQLKVGQAMNSSELGSSISNQRNKPDPLPPHNSNKTSSKSEQRQVFKSRPPSHVHVHRSNSMEVLALVSGEIRERHLKDDKASAATATTSNGVLPASAALAVAVNEETAALAPSDMKSSGSVGSAGSGNINSTAGSYSYKKLAPGMTPKNNKRLFVKHSYRDHSQEEPLPEELFLVRSQDTAVRTPNAAFPLKLHETLYQIEQDGFGHIIGWLPHGRSFKIHKQKEFVEVVLKKYFVMSKKSSFLRQLNLYGFNRLSAGPDSGSYYHEKFLRGLKFLCRRMTRQKVNGNGIRAAGNPDEEPNLSRFPVCPPSLGNTSASSSVIHNDTELHEADGENNRPYSRLVSTAPSRPYSQILQNLSFSKNNGEKGFTMITDEHSHDSVGSESKKKGKSNNSNVDGNNSVSSGGGGQSSFPLKLQRILDKADADGKIDIVSWLPHGRAFLVHDVDRFVSEVMSLYFNQTKYSSFQRQLHMYCFQRITFGRDKGAYHHPNFQRGRPELCLQMARTRVNGKGCRRPGDPDNEPDFYEMEAVPPISHGTFVEIPLDVPTIGGNDDDDSEAHVMSGDEA